MGNTPPLCHAVRNGNVEDVKHLLTSGVDVNAREMMGDTPIHLAVLRGHVEMVRILASHPKIELNIQGKHGWTPLIAAALHGQVEVLNELIKDIYGVDINVQGHSDGYTALHWAAQQGNVQVARILANHPKIKMSIKANNGDTPLMVAARLQHAEVLKVFTSGLF